MPVVDFNINKLFAVHVTSILPKGGRLTPGFSTLIADETESIEAPNWRCTLHWCLGGVIPSEFFDKISLGNDSAEAESDSDFVELIENRSIAIVTQLINLLPQLANIFTSDTITIGPYQLSNKDYIILPFGTDIETNGLLASGVKIKFYNPLVTSLDSAVNDTINGCDGWCIRNEYSQSVGAGIPNKALIAPAEENINTVVFFKSLLKEYPQVSFGGHDFALTKSKISEITMDFDCCIGSVLALLDSTRDGDSTGDNDEKSTNLFTLYIFNTKLKMLLEWIDNSHLSAEHKKLVVQHLKTQSHWFNLLVLEAKLNISNLSLVPTLHDDPEFSARLIDCLRISLNAAQEFVRGNQGKLAVLRAESGIHFQYNVQEMGEQFGMSRHIPKEHLFTNYVVEGVAKACVDNSKVERQLKNCVDDLRLLDDRFEYEHLLDRHASKLATISDVQMDSTRRLVVG